MQLRKVELGNGLQILGQSRPVDLRLVADNADGENHHAKPLPIALWARFTGADTGTFELLNDNENVVASGAAQA